MGQYLDMLLISLLPAFVLATQCMAVLGAQLPAAKLRVCSPYAGCVQGTAMPGYQRSEEFEAFLGIPYALPPIGELRFNNPKSYPRWWGVLNATKAKMDCIQKNYLVPQPVVYGSEDCLYLNVYRPAMGSKELLPVMVYIYGGGWFSGSAGPQLHGPEYFMDTQEVILVTIAYRLGAFGFLSTNDVYMAGNFGLKDQNLALRWVQKNILFFGGNPKTVTLFGQSAGAVSAKLHMLSAQSEGLFRSIIVMSGTENVPFAITDDPLAQTRKFADLCNISGAYELSTAKLSRALRNVDAAVLLNAGDGLKYWHVDRMVDFRPVVERSGGSDAFLTRHPEELLATGDYHAVPWLGGFVPQEGAVRALSIMSNETLRVEFNAHFDELLERLMELPAHFNRTQLDGAMHRLREEYFGGRRELNAETVQGLLDIITDRGFHRPLFNALHAHVNTLNTNRHPVYLYKFNYSGPRTHTFANIYTGGRSQRDYGVVHCDDLIYAFRSPILFPDFAKNSTHAAVVAAFVGNFVHFAKYGKPMSGVTALKPCTKQAINSETEKICDYQEFTNAANGTFDVTTNDAFRVKRALLWNELLQNEFTKAELA